MTKVDLIFPEAGKMDQPLPFSIPANIRTFNWLKQIPLLQ